MDIYSEIYIQFTTNNFYYSFATCVVFKINK